VDNVGHRLSKVALDELNKFYRRLDRARIGLRCLLEHVLSDMTIEDFCHERVHRPATGRQREKHVAAAPLAFHCFFQPI